MREFTANQEKYMELVDSDVVVVARENARPIIIRVANDEDNLSEAELRAIQKGFEDIKNGRTYRMREGESLTEFLERTEECIR
jgi:prevent-host-death family protein